MPAGWVWTTLGEACEIVLGQSPPSSTYNTQGIGLPFYQGKAEFGDLYPSPVRWCAAPVKVAKAGDVLVSVRAPVGPTNLCRERSCIGRGLAAVRPRVGMPARYFFYWLRSVARDWADQATGTTFSAISGKTLKRREVPLAPLAEQLRIVASIEGHLSRLDAAVVASARVQAKLGRYRATVLKEACEGKLVITEAALARFEGRAYEPASQIVTRVLAERRAQGTKKRRRPLQPDFGNLPPLPEGWCWASLGQLLERIDAGRSPRTLGRPAGSGEFGVLKVSAVSWGAFASGENKALLPGEEPCDALVLRAGDLLVSRANTVDLVGAAVLVDRDYPHLMLSDKTLRLVPASKAVARQYLLYALRTPRVRDYFAMQATGTSDSMRNISQAKLRALSIPLPPAAEQRRIVAEIERRFAAVEALETAIEVSLDRAGQLRQAILEEAFAGRLVPQDPADEPASVLLARVREDALRTG